jgi:hypothetical protein
MPKPDAPEPETSQQDVDAEQREARRQEQIRCNQAAIEMLKEWVTVGPEEAEEQRETLAFLMRALDEDRPSYRKLFP